MNLIKNAIVEALLAQGFHIEYPDAGTAYAIGDTDCGLGSFNPDGRFIKAIINIDNLAFAAKLAVTENIEWNL